MGIWGSLVDPEGLAVRGKLLRWRLASLLPEHQLGDDGEVQEGGVVGDVGGNYKEVMLTVFVRVIVINFSIYSVQHAMILIEMVLLMIFDYLAGRDGDDNVDGDDGEDLHGVRVLVTKGSSVFSLQL